MTSHSPGRSSWTPNRVVASAIALAFAALAGCAQQINNPYTDSAALPPDEMTTSSAKAYRTADKPALQDRRAWQESTVAYHRTPVTHWPLMWEDPFVGEGNGRPANAERDAAD
ncbi:MAG: hypothetical protein V3T70_01040 [Phycisphaerae bacterium]